MTRTESMRLQIGAKVAMLAIGDVNGDGVSATIAAMICWPSRGPASPSLGDD